MSSDIMILGGVVFDGHDAPSGMPFGGKHAFEVHKLPGGRRVVDLLGPDEMDIAWSGHFYGDDAYDKAMILNGIRIAGAPVPLIYAGQFYQVLISEFTPTIRRMPVWVEYRIQSLRM